MSRNNCTDITADKHFLKVKIGVQIEQFLQDCKVFLINYTL